MLGVVLHACSSNYAVGGDGRIVVQGQPEQDPVSKISHVWWYVAIIPAMREVEIGDSRPKASPRQKMGDPI
jgi:hypothetical protein